MSVPLAQVLAEFTQASPPPPFVDIDIEPMEAFEPLDSEPMVTMSVAAYEQALEQARTDAAAKATATAEAAMQARFDEERAALTTDFETTRESWAQEQGKGLSESLTAAVAQLEQDLSTALANALRPLFAETCHNRVFEALRASLDALLSDPACPPIRIEGPADLLTAFGTAHGNDLAIDYVESDHAELSIIAETTRIETRLSACLAALKSEG